MQKKAINTNLDFLSKLQLIQPFCNRNDGSRATMVSAHIQQYVPVKGTEIPLCSSIYNNVIVGKSTRKLFVKATENTAILGTYKIENDTYQVLIKQDSKVLDIIQVSDFVNEGGFTSLSNYNTDNNATFKEGDIIRYNGETDENMNLKIGKNCNVAYIMNGNNFEDAFFISESFANSFTHTETEDVEFVLNSNEYFINVFGDNENYKPFPTGDENKFSRIICAKRKINKTFIDNLTNRNFKSIHIENDEIFYGKGKIQSITVLTNDRKQTKNTYNNYINSLVEQTEAPIKEFLSDIGAFMKLNKEFKVTKDLNYMRLHYTNIVLKKKPLIHNEKEFSGYYFKIRLVREVPVKVGSKITSFHASKGLVTKIVPDSEMPTTADGRVADIGFNVNSVIGRLNLGQINEVLVNKIGEKVAKLILETKDINHYTEFLSNFIDEYQINTIKKLLETDESKESLIEDIRNIGLVKPIIPFTQIKLEEMKEMLDKYEVSINEEMYVNGRKLDNEVLFGKLYIIKLKHEPDKKMSYSSFNKVSDKTLQPTKDQNSYKKNKSINTFNPSSIAEMELSALLVLPKKSFLKESIYLKSSDYEARMQFLKKSLYAKTESGVSIKDFTKETEFNHLSMTALNHFLPVIGIELKL